MSGIDSIILSWNYAKWPAGLANGDAEKSLAEAEQTMMTVLSLTEADLPNRSQFIATLYSSLGNAYLELGQTDQALEHFEKDMKIAEEE